MEVTTVMLHWWLCSRGNAALTETQRSRLLKSNSTPLDPAVAAQVFSSVTSLLGGATTSSTHVFREVRVALFLIFTGDYSFNHQPQLFVVFSAN